MSTAIPRCWFDTDVNNLSIYMPIPIAMFAQSIIQVVVTFHGGMIALAYEWGSRNHNTPHDRSPDENANSDIGE